ncbi:PREDICTED: uncharacterized protein LOC109359615 [Lupinus angustifolius]|uniref:uncharacterized protein LOC109359615 n=1 Tax=Lupinus angustifolius TaxID=3871 RepID=UPI00092E2547|nr:PREDICTED: uncharacterized protein LOC109359615 [Lupinus angustifolius]
MDPNTKALIIYEGNKIRDNLLNKLEMLSHSSFTKVQSLTHDNVIIATPISSIPHDKSYSSYLKVVQNGSSSKRSSIPNCRKSTIAKEEKYSVNWKIEAQQRSNGKWDKEYYHKVLPVMCRSLLEIERFEADGTLPPKRKGKRKKIENVEEVERERVAKNPKEVVTIDMLLADAYNNLQIFCGQQNITSEWF